MEIKLFELLDEATFIPAIAIAIDRSDGFLARAAGYGHRCILFSALRGGTQHYDPYQWGDRTFQTAHQYIEKNWDELSSGDVVDVEFILGETKDKKPSEKINYGL